MSESVNKRKPHTKSRKGCLPCKTRHTKVSPNASTRAHSHETRCRSICLTPKFSPCVDNPHLVQRGPSKMRKLHQVRYRLHLAESSNWFNSSYTSWQSCLHGYGAPQFQQSGLKSRGSYLKLLYSRHETPTSLYTQNIAIYETRARRRV